MRQVVLTAPKQIEFREVAAPEAGNLKSDEVLLRILRIGICGSEIHSYHGQHHRNSHIISNIKAGR